MVVVDTVTPADCTAQDRAQKVRSHYDDPRLQLKLELELAAAPPGPVHTKEMEGL